MAGRIEVEAVHEGVTYEASLKDEHVVFTSKGELIGEADWTEDGEWRRLEHQVPREAFLALTDKLRVASAPPAPLLTPFDAASLIEELRRVAILGPAGNEVQAYLQKFLRQHGVPALRRCPGEAHCAGGPDNCALCSPRWGFIGPPVRVRPVRGGSAAGRRAAAAKKLAAEMAALGVPCTAGSKLVRVNPFRDSVYFTVNTDYEVVKVSHITKAQAEAVLGGYGIEATPRS